MDTETRLPEDSQTPEFNAWLKSVEKELIRQPHNLQVQAVNYLYRETYNRLDAEVSAQKANLAVSEKTFGGFLFKLEDNAHL